jgi:hypothetical protein
MAAHFALIVGAKRLHLSLIRMGVWLFFVGAIGRLDFHRTSAEFFI